MTTRASLDISNFTPGLGATRCTDIIRSFYVRITILRLRRTEKMRGKRV